MITHTGRPAGVDVAREITKRLTETGIRVRMLASEATEIGVAAASVVPDDEDPAAGCEIALAVGGDGTILRAAELTRPSGTPVLAVEDGGSAAQLAAERIALNLHDAGIRSVTSHA